MKKYKSKKWFLFSLCMAVTMLSGCLGKKSSKEDTLGQDSSQVRYDTGFVVTGPNSYDSADTTIVTGKDIREGKITFVQLALGKRYTLSYDGTTHFYDRYGESIAVDQIERGDIVDVTFLKSKKHLTTVSLSSKAWRYENIDRYEMDSLRGEVTIGTEVYKLSEQTLYTSFGTAIDRMDLYPTDTLCFQGIDSEILSVTVEKGHGYLRLLNDENFVGGWIEIGQSIVQQISQDMLLTVPEGSYQVQISHRGGGGTKQVVINRNEETILDIGDLTVQEQQYGTLLFSLNPATATLYIDGEKQDITQPVRLPYGMHQLIAKADGYQSVTKYLKVGQPSAGVDINLDVKEEDNETPSENATEKGAENAIENKTESETKNAADVTETVANYEQIYVDAPSGVEVYVDGNYVGISPCSWRKQSGTHVITLRKTGYETRSYTVQVSEEQKDMSYSFVDLIKEDVFERDRLSTES